MSMDDAPLIEASIDRPEVFGEIYDRHASEVLGYLIRRVGVTNAEGMLSDVFLTAFESRHRFDLARTSARPWLYGIAANLVMKHYRSLGRRQRAVDRLAARGDLEIPSFEDRLVERSYSVGLLQRVVTEVNRLPERDREVVLLYGWQNLSYSEIAEAMEIPVGTVRSRLNRVRGTLRELIDGSGKVAGEPSKRAPGGTRR